MIYKFRSMRDDCERETGPRWSTVGDDRVTGLGRFLRRSHLDELPQLWNVLRGEMGLVGPRPERPEIASRLEVALSGYGDRLSVKPGVTGLAQVQLPADSDLESVRSKLECDLYYIQRMNLLLDFKIVLATATKVVGIAPAKACSRLGVPVLRRRWPAPAIESKVVLVAVDGRLVGDPA